LRFVASTFVPWTYMFMSMCTGWVVSQSIVRMMWDRFRGFKRNFKIKHSWNKHGQTRSLVG
jgi:hypothetical protein